MPHKKNILLIEPPFYRLYKKTYGVEKYPLGLGYLAGAILKNTDWQIKTYNADFTPIREAGKVSYLAGEGFKNYLNNLNDIHADIWKEIEDCIKSFRPAVIGMSCKTQNFRSACNIAKIAKAVDDSIKIIAGGCHPTMVREKTLELPQIDVAVVGEGERTIVDLLNAIENNGDLNNVQGIIYRNNGRIVATDPRPLIENLDELDFPHQNAAITLKDFEKYPITAFRGIFAIRGCPYNCVYCGSRNLWGRKPRFRSVENVIDEICSLHKIGLRSVHFEDDTFGTTREYINLLCSAIRQSGLGIKWSCEMHVRLVDEPTIKTMRHSGCYMIQLGVESGCNEMLRHIRKNITIEQAYRAGKIIRDNGIELQAFFMIGMPQETENSLLRTMDAIRKMPYDIAQYSIFTPYPGTEAFELCESMGLIDKNYDPALYNHQSPANHFCPAIEPAKFRQYARKIERIVDRRNAANRIIRLASPNSLWRIREIGFAAAAKKGLKILAGK